MVYYFLSLDGKILNLKANNLYMIGHTIYMGKDKFENEKLLKYAWPEDVWF